MNGVEQYLQKFGEQYPEEIREKMIARERENLIVRAAAEKIARAPNYQRASRYLRRFMRDGRLSPQVINRIRVSFEIHWGPRR